MLNLHENDKIIFNGYKKLTFSGRFLNFYSQHLICHKKEIIYNMIDRIVLLFIPKSNKKISEIMKSLN